MANKETTDLIRAATAFVDELQRMGYGQTSDRALPGSYHPFVEALNAAKEKLIDKALDQDGD